MIGWASLSWPHSPHLILLSPQGDSGEMGFPGMAGLFGPKVQIPTPHCSCWGSIHPPLCSFIHVFTQQKFLEHLQCGLESYQNQAGTSWFPRTHIPAGLGSWPSSPVFLICALGSYFVSPGLSVIIYKMGMISIEGCWNSEVRAEALSLIAQSRHASPCLIIVDVRYSSWNLSGKASLDREGKVWPALRGHGAAAAPTQGP